MSDKIWLASPHMSEEGYELKFIKEAFDSNWIAPLGPNVTAFEEEVAHLVGVKHAAALSSGTAAIHLALLASGVGPGDIVLCQDLTFSATVNPVIYVQATPVFIDSDFATWNMDPKLLHKALEKYGSKVKAVIPVHLYGLTADMDKIKRLCDEYDVTLIEDAAEALGSLYKGHYAGSLSDYGVFSFNGNKIITTSGGGMLVSNNKERIEKVRFWSTQARDPAPYYKHSEIGYNYRLSNVLAGIGRGQLRILDKHIDKKRYIFEYYKRELSELDGISFMPINEWNKVNYWLSVIQLNGEIRPKDIWLKLQENNIQSRPVWRPMHQQEIFSEYDYIGSGVSSELFENGLCLPSDCNMTEEDLEKVCACIKSLW